MGTGRADSYDCCQTYVCAVFPGFDWSGYASEAFHRVALVAGKKQGGSGRKPLPMFIHTYRQRTLSPLEGCHPAFQVATPRKAVWQPLRRNVMRGTRVLRTYPNSPQGSRFSEVFGLCYFYPDIS
mgnify:CR=1 FL=1